MGLLLVENIKSWRGCQVISPFRRFTCTISPNGNWARPGICHRQVLQVLH
uniref:Uncharacterized protein n=1 Tax=Prolemur simus TaxID=1328070 RepID=A0A8C9AGV0_PROSS